MIVSKVEGCCSMLTVSNNPNFKFIRRKKDFLIYLRNAINNYNDIYKGNKISLQRIKTVILITNESWLYRPSLLKKAYTYNGYDNRKAHVCHIDFKYGLHEEFKKYEL